MVWTDLLSALGGATVVLAAIAFLGKLIAEKSAEAAMKRFESTLKRAEAEYSSILERTEAGYGSSLKRLEAEHGALLKTIEELNKSTLAFTSAVDTDLRTRRIEVYSELWEKSGTLPLWPRNRDLSYTDLQNLALAFRDWYFKKGGIYLSRNAREAYGELQKHLTSVLSASSEGLVTDSDYESIQKKCSALRTELTTDLLSRREAPDVL